MKSLLCGSGVSQKHVGYRRPATVSYGREQRMDGYGKWIGLWIAVRLDSVASCRHHQRIAPRLARFQVTFWDAWTAHGLQDRKRLEPAIGAPLRTSAPHAMP